MTINWDGGVSPCCWLHEHKHDFANALFPADRTYLEWRCLYQCAPRLWRGRPTGRIREGHLREVQRVPALSEDLEASYA